VLNHRLWLHRKGARCIQKGAMDTITKAVATMNAGAVGGSREAIASRRRKVQLKRA